MRCLRLFILIIWQFSSFSNDLSAQSVFDDKSSKIFLKKLKANNADWFLERLDSSENIDKDEFREKMHTFSEIHNSEKYELKVYSHFGVNVYDVFWMEYSNWNAYLLQIEYRKNKNHLSVVKIKMVDYQNPETAMSYPGGKLSKREYPTRILPPPPPPEPEEEKLDTSISVLAGIDFSQKDYQLYGVQWNQNWDIPEIQEEIGYFLLNDSDVLRKIQKEWAYTPGSSFQCGYHYVLFLYQDDSLIQTMNINLICSSFSYENKDGSGLSSPKFVSEYKDHFKKMTINKISFDSKEDLLKKKQGLRKNPKVFLPPDFYKYQDIYFLIEE